MTARWMIVLPALAASAACGGSEPPRGVANAPKTDAEASSTVVDAAAGAAAEDASASRALLPSGEYEVTTEVKLDTCSKNDAGASVQKPVNHFVQVRVSRDKSGSERVTGSFPLPMPRTGGFGSARSDIVLSPHAPEEPATSKGSSRCPGHETTTRYEVLEQTGERVKVRYTRDYGDASSCTGATRPPSKCSLDYVYTFTLVNKLCDAHCHLSFAIADSGNSTRCDCDD